LLAWLLLDLSLVRHGRRLSRLDMLGYHLFSLPAWEYLFGFPY
jgi:hypothetical protein